MTDPDGNLPAALDQLHAAVAAICDPIKGWFTQGTMQAPSLYQQLVDDLPARAGESPGRFHGSSTPPVFMDALHLRTSIDRTVQEWCPAGTSTPDRLRRMAAARWRPQDAERLSGHANELQRWAASIKAVLDPEHVKSVKAPCPVCGVKTVYRTNKAGERVRQAALQLVTEVGCTCLACDTHWPPDQYMWLVKLLGFDTPAGVVG